MDAFGRNVLHAWRRLRGSPVFTAFAVLTLAVGIGATTAVYAVVRVVTGPPSGVRGVDRIVNLTHSPRGSVPIIGLSWPDYQNFLRQQTVFESVTGWRFFQQAYVADGVSETAYGEAVTGEYFHVLGVEAAMGRTLLPADDHPAATPVVVISHGVWQRVFGGRRDVLGRQIKMNGHAFEIVGVARDDFHGVWNNGFVASAMWIPLASMARLPNTGAEFDPNERERRWLLVKARLRPGRTVHEAQAEATAIAHVLDAAHPIGRGLEARFRSPYNVSRPWTVRRLSDVILNETADFIMRPLVWTLMTAVALVLLIACTNLANLMLARSSGRRHDVAVRVAMGASRGRLVREELIETLLLACAGGVLSLGVTRLLLYAMGNEIHAGSGLVLRAHPTVDGVVIGVALAATVLAIAIAGLVPAAQSTRGDVRSMLTSEGPGVSMPRWRGRRVLIAAQVAVSMVLLAVAALCVSQVRAELERSTGVDLRHMAVMEVDFQLQSYEEGRVQQVVDAMLGVLGRHPGIEAAAASSGLPFGLFTPGGTLRAADQPRGARVELMAATPQIFGVMNVRIVRGRAIDGRDTAGSGHVAVVSEHAARTAFGTIDVVGRAAVFLARRWVGMPEPIDEPVTIVGVTADTDAGMAGRRDHGVIYLPLAQHHESRLVFSLRTRNPAAHVETLRRALYAVDPELAVSRIGTGSAVAGPSNAFLQVVAMLATVLGAFALVLALAGLFGALSHVVAGRTHEIGVRVSLGASRAQVMRMILVDGLRPVVSGVVLGLAIGAIARAALTPMFVRLLPAMDPVVLIVAPAFVIAAALVACYLPSRRAASVDPTVALRQL